MVGHDWNFGQLPPVVESTLLFEGIFVARMSCFTLVLDDPSATIYFWWCASCGAFHFTSDFDIAWCWGVAFFWLCDLMCRERFCVSPQRKRILFWCNSMAATTAIAWLGHIWEYCSFVPCLWDSHVGAPVEFGYKLWNVLFWMRANCCVLARIAHLHADDCVFSDR